MKKILVMMMAFVLTIAAQAEKIDSTQFVAFYNYTIQTQDEELAARPQQPLRRNRVVSKALRAYAQSVSSADKGGIRIIE